MITEVTLLVILVKLVDQIPVPKQPQKRGPGRRKTYPDRLIVKALVVMVNRRIYSAFRVCVWHRMPAATGELPLLC